MLNVAPYAHPHRQQYPSRPLEFGLAILLLALRALLFALYESCPFAESAIQILLALALEFDCISASEAQNILKATLHRKKQLTKMAGTLINGHKAGKRLEMSEHEAEAAAFFFGEETPGTIGL